MKIISKILGVLSRYGWTSTLVVLGIFAVGFTFSSSEALYDNIRLFDRAALTVSSSYVEDVNEFELIRAGIDGMMARLDPYSRFLSGADYDLLRQETDGEFEGIGVSLEYHHDTLTVKSVLDGTPGYYKGIKPGDRIIYIDKAATAGLNLKKIKTLLKGPEGSIVTIRIHRPGQGEMTVVLQREVVEIKAIPYCGMIDDKIGYIRLSKFFEGSSDEMRVAIKSLKRQGMTSLILDMRDNPGGLLAEGIDIAGMFLKVNDRIVETRAKNNLVINTYLSERPPIFDAGGLAVLVDSETASAAEIVAGAIQDHDRGIIIGNATFGKGLVQQVIQFTEDAALKLTTSKYYLPSGRCLQKPDWSPFELNGKPDRQSSDSLFLTDAGRPVFGGGGIIPDVYVDGRGTSPYIENLKSQSLFFDFAISYIQKHAIDGEFKVTDAIYEEFKQFLKSRNYQYQDDRRRAFNDFKETLISPNEKMRLALDQINGELKAREEWEFESHYSEIRDELQSSILTEALGEAEYYRKVVTVSQPEVIEALKVLKDNNRYSSILAVR